MAAKKKTIVEYVMMGPQAVENRLAQLDEEFDLARARLKRKARAFSGFVTKMRGKRLLPGTRILRQIHKERKALKAFVGKQLRAWEMKHTGPAPLA